MAHTCHAHGCSTPVPPRMFMCRRHWLKVRRMLQSAVWRFYRPGQEVDKSPSSSYMAIHYLCVAELAYEEWRQWHTRAEAIVVVREYLVKSQTWRQRAIDAGARDPLEGLLLPCRGANA